MEITMRMFLMAMLLQGCAAGYDNTTVGDKVVIGGLFATMALIASNYMGL